MIEIREATKSQAAEIACLIMTVMTDNCYEIISTIFVGQAFSHFLHFRQSGCR